MSDSNEFHDPGSDEIRWQDYEELVKDIYEVLGRANGVTIECWGSSCRVEGPPGVFHQIDVLTVHSDGLHQYRTAISCKNWNKKVGIPIVREFSQIIADARLSKGVMVSKMGFTGPAMAYAEAKSIGLVELRRPLDKDWDGYIKEVHITLMLDQTEIHDVNFNITAPKPGPGEEVYRGGPIHWPLLLNQIFIGIPGQEAETFQKLADDEWSKDEEKEVYNLQFPEGSILTVPDFPDYPAHDYSITGATFKVRSNPPITEEIVVRADEHIYMIMESLFDGRRFTIAKDGQITENLPPSDGAAAAGNTDLP